MAAPTPLAGNQAGQRGGCRRTRSAPPAAVSQGGCRYQRRAPLMESSHWNCSDIGRMATDMAARSMEQMKDTAGESRAVPGVSKGSAAAGLLGKARAGGAAQRGQAQAAQRQAGMPHQGPSSS